MNDLIEKIIKDNLDILIAIANLDKNFGENTYTCFIGETPNITTSTTNGINQIIQT